MKTLSKIIGATGIIVSAAAMGVPDPYYRFLIALGAGLNAAAIYLLKGELDGCEGPQVDQNNS